jgi:hypothetical protein
MTRVRLNTVSSDKDNTKFLNVQTAAFPTELAEMVDTLQLQGRTGWEFILHEIQRDMDHGRGEARGLTFEIVLTTRNSRNEGFVSVRFLFEVPAATYDRRSWRRWLFERVRDVELHELMEAFEVDGEVPFAPLHLPGADPYTIYETSTDLERRTSFRGVVGE